MESLVKRFSEKYAPEETERFQRALEFETKHHEGQKRESGESYITHPIAVASIVMDMGMDAASVTAAILHDTV